LVPFSWWSNGGGVARFPAGVSWLLLKYSPLFGDPGWRLKNNFLHDGGGQSRRTASRKSDRQFVNIHKVARSLVSYDEAADEIARRLIAHDTVPLISNGCGWRTISYRLSSFWHCIAPCAHLRTPTKVMTEDCQLAPHKT
jgi:hypothetical protein